MPFYKRDNTIPLIIAKTFAGSILALIFSFLIAHQISRISRSVSQERSLNFLVQKRIENAAYLYSDIAQIGGAKTVFVNALIPADRILEFVGSLETLAHQTSMRQSLKFGSPSQTDEPDIMSLEYSIELRGNILTFIRYMSEFQKLPYFTAMKSITINAPTDGWMSDSSFLINGNIFLKQDNL